MEFLLNTVYDALSEIADTEQVDEQVTVQVERLLNVMGDKEYSTREMMELLGLKHRPSFRDNYLLPALKLGYIRLKQKTRNCRNLTRAPVNCRFSKEIHYKWISGRCRGRDNRTAFLL